MGSKTINIKVLTLGLAIALSSGCSTILNDDTQRVNITSSNSKPFEGRINGDTFIGPGVVEVKRKNADKVVYVDTEGCSQETLMAKQVDTKFFINILSGGALGSTTDYATERMWKYDDNVVVQCG